MCLYSIIPNFIFAQYYAAIMSSFGILCHTLSPFVFWLGWASPSRERYHRYSLHYRRMLIKITSPNYVGGNGH